MLYTTLFSVVGYLPVLLPAIIMFSSNRLFAKTRGFFVTTLVAVLVCWLVLVLFMIFVYNPLGILAAYEAGADFPEVRYDNNTVGPVIFFGWLSPTLMGLLLYFEPKFKEHIVRRI